MSREYQVQRILDLHPWDIWTLSTKKGHRVFWKQFCSIIFNKIKQDENKMICPTNSPSPKEKPSKHSSWCRRLQDVLIKTNIFDLVIRLQTSSRCLDQDQYICLGHTSSRRLVKASSRHLQDVLLRRLSKTSSRHLQDVFKTSSRRLAKISSRHFQDVSSS